ncbi:MAG: hypothetical protein ACLSIL_16795 [Enterococcus casseliflavus]
MRGASKDLAQLAKKYGAVIIIGEMTGALMALAEDQISKMPILLSLSQLDNYEWQLPSHDLHPNRLLRQETRQIHSRC